MERVWEFLSLAAVMDSQGVVDDRNIETQKLLFSISGRLSHYLFLLLLSSERLSFSAIIIL